MSRASPPSCPKVSLTSLKSSTSINRTLSWWALRSAPGLNDAARRAVNAARFGNPVSESCVALKVSARWLSCSAPAIPLNASQFPELIAACYVDAMFVLTTA